MNIEDTPYSPQQLEKLIDQRVARALRATAALIEASAEIQSKEESEPTSLAPRQIAAAMAAPSRAKKIATTPKKEHWSKRQLKGYGEMADETNIYQILLHKFGMKQFDIRNFSGMHISIDKRVFNPQPSFQRVLNEMKHLEAEKLARPMDAERLKWILERV